MNMPHSNDAYQTLRKELREIGLLYSVSSLLHWDQETYMPPGGAEGRAEQAAFLATMAHERVSSPKLAEMLANTDVAARSEPADGEIATNVRETRRVHERAVKIPASLVEEVSRTSVLGHHAWAEARKNSDFAAFRPWLEKMLDLKRQEASCVGYPSGEPYDALLDEYEPGESAAGVQQVFDSLRGPLVELIGRIASSVRKAPVEILNRSFPVDAQRNFAQAAAAAIGFDFNRGRLDVSVHPFCTGIAPGDTRMTTRYDEHEFRDAFFGTLHETGHCLYEQGLPPEHFGTPCGDSISLGIHESQSRMWENLVGRSRAFWKHFFPKVQATFAAAKDVREEDWYFAVNDIRPSFIRTESDEATYNLHVLIRFELERAMLRGDLKVADLPGAWNERMQKYLGITPPDDAQGCLQDTHWSGGAIGYFPTYTLGNLYAAQFFEAAQKELGDLDAMFAQGEFRPLLDWLRRNIHAHGKRYRAQDLVKNVTGVGLSPEPLLRHLRKKADELYLGAGS